ncbi:MAG: hypothetical protein N2201_07285 [candidate division WOR-3 bacterium]|nr:hypothetical protein [candidate division WOR-3 bacterium]
MKRSQKDKRKSTPAVKNLDQIVEDFTDKLIKGEKITIDQVLKKYPEIAPKLKPLLKSAQILLQTSEEFKQKITEELKTFDEALWQKLEQTILQKSLKTVQKQLNQLKRFSTKPLSQRFEYLILLLYVKGYRSRLAEGIRGITRLIKVLFLLQKETDIAKLIKRYYEFVPYKIGPFEPAIYQDLKVLEMAGLIKRQTYKYPKPPSSLIDEGFGIPAELNEATLFSLTEKGIEYAKALAHWCEQKDPNILLALRRIKSKYASAPLKKLLKYIYTNYPEYTQESEVLAEILK